MSTSSAVYAATLHLDQEVSEDTADNTNIAIHIGDKPDNQVRSTTEHTPCNSIVTWFVQSNTVRYLTIVCIVGILIILLERFLGYSAVADQLRSLLANSIGEVTQVALSLHSNVTKASFG